MNAGRGRDAHDGAVGQHELTPGRVHTAHGPHAGLGRPHGGRCRAAHEHVVAGLERLYRRRLIDRGAIGGAEHAAVAQCDRAGGRIDGRDGAGRVDGRRGRRRAARSGTRRRWRRGRARHLDVVHESLDAVDGAGDLGGARALLAGVDRPAQRHDAGLGPHVDLEKVRGRLRGQPGRDLGGDPRVVDELAHRARVGRDHAADRERQQRGEREGGDASPHSGHGSGLLQRSGQRP